MALALAPVALAAMWAGGWWYAGFLAVAGVAMAGELTAMVHDNDRGQLAMHVVTVLAATLGLVWLGGGIALAAVAAGWAATIARLYATGRFVTIWNVFGCGYIAVPLLALGALRDGGEWGLSATVWLFAAVWSADTLAYFAGRGIGGAKLWPRVSPNKTWAGFAGAVAGAGLVGVLGAPVAGVALSPWLIGLAGLLGAVEQGGDLYESAMKRHYGVKDSGRTIPGHGGVLDRLDGVMAAAVVAVVVGLVRAGPGDLAAGVLLW